METVAFEVHHTEDGVRHAASELWDARYRKAWLTSMGVAVVLMTVAFATRELPWYLAVPLTAVILHAAFLRWNRDRVMDAMAGALRRAEPPVFRYRLDAPGLAESSAIGNAELPWDAFAQLREGRDFVFLLRAPLETGMFIAFPRAQLPSDALAVLRTHVPPG